MIETTLLLIIFLFVAPTKAQAYLDPGTGSFITQMLIGFVAGSAYLIKMYWSQLKEKISNLSNNKKKNDSKKGK